MNTATKRQFADHLLGGRFDQYVEERRAAEKGWRQIATDLKSDTGLDVSHETLRRWFTDEAEDDAPEARSA